MNPTKIALCLSGFVRSHQLCMVNLHKYLLDNPKLQIDTFCHTWNISDRLGPKTNINHITKSYNPKKIIIDEPKLFKITDEMIAKNKDKRNLNDLLSEFYSVEQCNNIKAQFECDNHFIYDAVIRFRFDIKLESHIPLDNSTNLHNIFIPEYGDYEGINNQFAYSNSENMNKYCSFFSNYEQILTQEPAVNPEAMFKRHINSFNLPIIRPSIKYILAHKRTSNHDLEHIYWYHKSLKEKT